MSVLAVIAARNEAGYIEQTLRSLLEDGIEVVLIDNGSIDGTRELAEAHLGGGLLEIVDLPWAGEHDLARLLSAKQDVFSRSIHEWHVHVDADEWLRANDDVRLASFLRDVDKQFSVVSFDVFDFLPPPGIDMWREDYRRLATSYYYFTGPPRLRWWRAWRRGTARDLVSGAGHQLMGVDEAALYPVRQTLRHYLGLSWSHSIAKRANRSYPDHAVRRGWHDNRLDMRSSHAMAGSAVIKVAQPWDTRQLDRSTPALYQFWEAGFNSQ